MKRNLSLIAILAIVFILAGCSNAGKKDIYQPWSKEKAKEWYGKAAEKGLQSI